MTLTCFVDVETSGTTPVERYAVLQIAGIICDGSKELETFDLRCAPHPGDMLSPKALEVNGLTIEQARAFPPPHEVHGKLVAIFGKHVRKYDKADKMFLAGYNGGFDTDHLRAWFNKCGDQFFGSWFWTPTIDVMTLAAMRLRGQRASMPNFKLTTVAEKLGVPLINAHDALADVRATKDIFEICERVAA